jgi:hypothetical protein
MLDNLRDQAASSPFFQEETPPEPPPEQMVEPPKPKSDRLFGMTAVQRFVIVLMLFFAVCLIGAMFMLITGKFVPSFLG